MQQSINLLYPATKAVTQTKKGPDLYVAILGLVIVLICPLLYGVLYYQENMLARKIADADAQITELSKPAPDDEIRRSLTSERNSMQKAISDITASKTVISKPLDEISKTMDPNVSLSSVDIQTEPRSITINGTAPSHEAVSRFQGNLELSKYFSDSYIKVSIKEVSNGVVGFTVQINPSEGVLK